MTINNIQVVLIIGYGVMGRGVAATFAAAGFDTVAKTRGTPRPPDSTVVPGSVTVTNRWPTSAPDLVIELVPEDLAAKQAVYAEIEAAYPDHDIIIATGTSGLDLHELGSRLRKPENFIGLHYFMPADTSKVVEVMAGPATPRALVDLVASALVRTGKEPVRLYRPIVGFLVNRLQHAILHEAYYLIEAGVATAAEIDHAARRLLAPRMCITGLIEQKDISGLRIHGHAQRGIVPQLYHNGVPNPMLQAMLQRGETGLDAGQGFYDWTGADVAAVRAQCSAKLLELMRFLDEQSTHAIDEPRARTTDELLGNAPGD